MAREYHYLVAGLPDLVFADRKMPFGVSELRQMVFDEVHHDDKPLVAQLFLPFDHVNISNALFQRKRPFNANGWLSQNEVMQLVDKKQAVELEALAPFGYISDCIQDVFDAETEISKTVFETRLTNAYYQMLEQSSCAFVQRYAVFDKNIRNVFAALNGRKFEMPFENGLIDDNDSVELLRKNRSRDFGLSSEIDNLEELLALFEIDDLVERELKLDLLRWHFIDEAVFFNYFSIERVLAFLLKLMMVERWMVLNEEKGRILFAQLLRDVQKGFSIPEEYKLSHGR
jgi:hypothetical protein